MDNVFPYVITNYVGGEFTDLEKGKHFGDSSMMHQDLLKCLNLICMCKDEVIITRQKWSTYEWLKYHPFDDMSSFSLNSRASFLEEEENDVESIMKTTCLLGI